MTTLSTAKKAALRTRAQHLSPVIIIGDKGLTTAVAAEIERALVDHELIKIKVAKVDKLSLSALSTQMCLAFNASLIQTIGHITVLYRRSDKIG